MSIAQIISPLEHSIQVPSLVTSLLGTLLLAVLSGTAAFTLFTRMVDFAELVLKRKEKGRYFAQGGHLV